MEIGAQLYTVRDFCKMPDDFADTLRRIAAIGYKTVQVSGTCAYAPEWLRDRLRETGLRCVLTHIPPDRIRDRTQEVMADHAVFGCRYIGIGCAPNGMAGGEADFETLCGIIGAAAKPFSDSGYRLMYHNHALEFARSADGRTWFDRLLERYGNAPLGFTLDTYWLQAAGLDAADFIRTLSGRVPCIHLKDMGVRGNASVMAPVGSGNMDFDKIIKACADAGAEYLLVEQDDCGGEDPFVCLKKSYQFLTSRGL